MYMYILLFIIHIIMSQTTKVQYMKDVVLHHFHFNSRAMVARAAMVYRNQPFVDKRIKYDEWVNLKYSGIYEFRVLPMLEVEGRKYTQMYAINNYIGRKMDLFFEDIEEDYKINSLLNSYEDFAGKSRKAHLLHTEQERIQAVDDFKNIHAPFYLQAYEDRYKKWGGKYMIGNKFTMADIYVTCYLYNNFLNDAKKKKLGNDYLTKFAPSLEKHVWNVKNNELKKFFETSYIEHEDPYEQKMVAELIRKT